MDPALKAATYEQIYNKKLPEKRFLDHFSKKQNPKI